MVIINVLFGYYYFFIFIVLILLVKRSITLLTSSPSPSLLNNSLKSPLAHPSLKDITATTKTLTNPPDLFLQPIQKRRSIRNKKVEAVGKDNDVLETTPSATTKLISVFPTTSDELDLEEAEIEHASSILPDDDSDTFLFGTSKIIPNLVLHENLDFSILLPHCEQSEVKGEQISEKDLESRLVIEPIIIEFKLEEQ